MKSMAWLGMALAGGLALAAWGWHSSHGDRHPSVDRDLASKSGADDAAMSTDAALLAKINPVVAQASQGQYVATKTFPGPDGLVGLVLTSTDERGVKIVAWASPHAQVLLPGALFDSTGNNLSDSMLKEYAGYLNPDQVATQAAPRGFVAGTQGPIVTAFLDPYCGHCATFLRDMAPFIEQGRYRLRVIFVGFLHPLSAARAADIMNAQHPYQALQAWEAMPNKFKAPAPHVSKADLGRIAINTTLFNDAGQPGTPMLVVCDRDQRRVVIVKGAPDHLEDFLQHVGAEGHPACNAP